VDKYVIEIRHNGKWVADGSLLVNEFFDESEALDAAEDIAKELASELNTSVEDQMRLIRVTRLI